jgi:hypothetical protein
MLANCQSALGWLVFQLSSQAAISSMRVCLPGRGDRLELARPPLARRTRDRRSYRGDSPRNRIEGLSRTGPQQHSERQRRRERRNGQPQHPTRGFSRPVECCDRSLKPCNPNAAIVSRQALSLILLLLQRPIDWPPAWVKANPPRSSRTCEHRTILAGPGLGAGVELKFCDTRAISPNQRS